MTETLKDAFWERAAKVRAGMLEARDAPARPMAHHAVRDDNALWFITAHGTDIADAAKAGTSASYQIASSDAHIYAAVEGTVTHVPDRMKLEELWSPMAAAWFDGGKNDPDVCLIRFDPLTAEVWATDGAAKFLYETAKANLTDDTPDVGDHGKITF